MNATLPKRYRDELTGNIAEVREILRDGVKLLVGELFSPQGVKLGIVDSDTCLARLLGRLKGQI